MRTGTDFHGLELLTFCGSGALGEVYRCRDLSGKILAVKIIPKQKLGGEWRRELKGVTYYRSLTETSPELLQIHHVGEDEENFFYTMDAADNAALDGDFYVPDTLAYRLRAGRIPPLALIRIARDILEGLSVIHAAGLFHRDIKPENILFVNGKARIGDMGLMASEQTILTHMAGTLAFLPPEMRSDNFSAEAAIVSRGDFYALGKVIYCAFTGKSPEEFPSLPASTVMDSGSKQLVHLCLALCETDPAERCSSPQQIRQLLDRAERIILHGETRKERFLNTMRRVGDSMFRALRQQGKRLRRHWLSALLILCVFGGIVWLLLPEKPYDLADEETKTFQSKQADFSMIIPFNWDPITEETVKQVVIEAGQKEMSEQGRKRLEFANTLLKLGIDYIIINFTGEFANNITILPVPIPGGELMAMSDDELRICVKSMLQGEFGYKTEIYEISRIEVDGRPCIRIYLSNEPDKYRGLSYFFPQGKNSINVVLTAAVPVFPELREQFEQVIGTVKFGKNFQ